MVSGLVCEICGNPIRAGVASCRFCGSRQEDGGVFEHWEGDRVAAGGRGSLRDDASTQFATCNIKEGFPTVAEAEQTLHRGFDWALASGAKVLTVIHGYGSSGRGGAIRDAARVLVRGKVFSGQVRASVSGEEFSTNCVETAALLRSLPWLRDHRDLGRGNRGITIVVL